MADIDMKDILSCEGIKADRIIAEPADPCIRSRLGLQVQIGSVDTLPSISTFIVS